MKVLMLSTDPAIAVEGSDAYKRMQEYAEVFGEIYIVTIHVSHSTIQNGNLFIYPVLGRFEMYRRGVKLCRENKFDVITTQSPDEIGLIGYFLSRTFWIPLQLQIHTDIMSPWYRRGSPKEYIRYLLAKFLIPRAQCLRVVGRRILDSIISNFQFSISNISLLPIYTDVSRFINARRDSKIDERLSGYDFKMISVGRFVDKEKNFTMLIEMMKEFVKICPKALLVLVGSGPDKKNYESRILNYGLEKYVTIESDVQDLPSFLKSFDLFVSSSNYEGWGRAIVEAMAAGLPVVMTDVGLAGEVVRNGENGIVVPVGNQDAMFAACMEMYQEPEKRKKCAENAGGMIQQLKTKNEYLDEYRDSLRACGIINS